MNKTEKSEIEKGNSLFKMYNNAGADVLAHWLDKLLVPIKTQADVALHNEIWTEVLLIINREERNFLKGLVDIILYKPVKRQKRFLFKVATLILEMGHKKG